MLRKLLVELVHRVIRLRARPHKATPIQRMAEGSLSPRGRVRVRGHSCLRSAFIYAPFVRQKLIIFVKAPCPGFVKTRLAEAVGPEKACVAYRKLVTTLLDRLGPIKEVELRFAPDDAASQMAPWLRPAWTAAPQRGGDLGERIRAAFDDAFAAGCERVTIIGSDCPAITANDIADSWNLLAQYDAVLGPAHDGGYWLIALKAPAPDLFTNIDWSTPRVLEQTLANLARTKRSFHFLRQLRDVDTADDWNRFVAETSASSQG